MKQHPIGIIMNGVTGRMGTNQHLVRSIVAIRNQGGVLLPDGTALMPDPVLVGRNEDKLNALAGKYGLTRWTTDLQSALDDAQNTIYFDAQTTQRRVADVTKAIQAGKHVYCEKPISETVEEALELARLANEKGVKHGVVQDKLFLPGIMKLKRLIASGFFGRILSVRGEFGYWVFEGDLQPGQRPSWNYRSEDGGGITVDMLCHWRYVLDHVFGPVRRVNCLSVTHIPERWDEAGKPYKATADDAAYACMEIDGGIIAQFNSSWTVRVNRDELFEMQVDGTHGSAVAGLRNCKTQHRVNTPKPVWNPDVPNPIDFRAIGWEEVPDNTTFDNAFKVQWEMFLKHVATGTPYVHDLLEGAKGVQLADLALQSSKSGKWMDVPELRIPGQKKEAKTK
jgi:predicted dehydrogenase